jgi:hypothetical protein
MSNNSKRADIMAAFVTRMQGITIVGGYATDIGKKVTEWKLTPYGASETEGLDIKDVGNTPDPDFAASGVWAWRMKIKVLVLAVKGTTTGTYIRSVIADILKAVGTDITWGGLAITTHQPEDNMVVDEQGKIIGDAEVDVEISYNTPRWQC